MSKYYISQTIVEVVDGRLTCREVVITRADAKVDKDSARLQNIKLFKSKLTALGIENLHVCEYDKKRYNKLVRAQNKRHKAARQLTLGEVAKIMSDDFTFTGRNAHSWPTSLDKSLTFTP